MCYHIHCKLTETRQRTSLLHRITVVELSRLVYGFMLIDTWVLWLPGQRDSLSLSFCVLYLSFAIRVWINYPWTGDRWRTTRPTFAQQIPLRPHRVRHNITTQSTIAKRA